MKILAIDTTTACCSCALSVAGDIVAKRQHVAENQHSQLLLRQVEEVLAEAQLQLKELTALAVDVGPGSFTGVRIGIGICQGLAYASGLPVVTVNSLETIASTVKDGWVLSLLDARMQQVYCALYEVQSYLPIEVDAPLVVACDAIPFDIEPNYQLLGNGVSVYQSYFAKFGANKKHDRYPTADQVARLAHYYGLDRAVEATALRAVYVRNNVVN